MLPKIDQPIFEIELPVSGIVIKYRPFLSKEEKILLMALESGEEDTMLDAIKQMITNCCLTPIDVDKMYLTDIEYFFLQLRARSVSEIVEAHFKCNNEVEKEGKKLTCDTIMEKQMNLLEIKAYVPDSKKSVVKITDKIAVKLKFPQLSFSKFLKKYKDSTEDLEMLYDLLANCIDLISDGDEIHKITDENKDELRTFLESLSPVHMSKLESFFDEQPYIEYNFDLECSECAYKHTISIKGVKSFF